MKKRQQRERLAPDAGAVEHSEPSDEAELVRIATYWLSEPLEHRQARRALAAMELARIAAREREPRPTDEGQAAAD